MIQIVEAKSKSQMKQFATFPVKLYKGCPYYVPSFIQDEKNVLNPKKNLSFSPKHEVKCFLAYDGKKLVGRIAAIINHAANEKNNEKMVRFSRIDMIDDINVTEALLNAVKKFGKEKGMEYIQGPWGFDDTDREGMLTYGFNEYSTYACAYSYPYYHEHMEKLGYEKESEWIENRANLNHCDPRFYKIAEMLKNRGYHDVSEDMKPSKVVKKYAQSFFDCYNKAYSELDNFVKIEGKQMQSVLDTFAVLLNQDYFSCIVDTKTDKVVAFGVALPYIGDAIRKANGDLIRALPGILKAKKKPRKLEFALIGVDPEYRNSGIHALVVTRLADSIIRNGIEDAVFDPTLTTNFKMLNTWQGMGLTLRCKRQTYRRRID